MLPRGTPRRPLPWASLTRVVARVAPDLEAKRPATHFRAMQDKSVPPAPDDIRPLAPELADAIVAEAASAYFAGCRDRIPAFVDRTFSAAGSARLHRHALGWDLLRGPANVALSLPQVGLKLASGAARGLGRRRMAEALGRRNLFLETAVARELRWRIMTELLREPFRDGKRESRVDGLGEAILAHPRVLALLSQAGATAVDNRSDPAFRERLELALTDYAGTRAAASEITTGLIALGTGALAFKQATPGALALGPALAAVLAHNSAVASFPLGAAAGGIWYGLFPVQASPLFVTGATAGVMGVAAVATAFSGMIADPVQRALGLHHRRLNALVDFLERAFAAQGDAAFVAYDLYVARLIDLSDLLISITRSFRPT